MRVIETVEEMRFARAELAPPVALVPTLGGLHAGHEALLTEARGRAAVVVASLFLNPTQFDDAADLDSYPRDRARDLEIFKRNGVDIVFAPTVEEIYPVGAETSVDPGLIGRVLEGRSRPGHFSGVATVVAKLLALIRPDVAFFGAKDAQQLVIVRRLVRDLLLGAEVAEVPTVRDEDGVALSSRLGLLDDAGRHAAATIYRALSRGEARVRDGVRAAAELRQAVLDELANESLVDVEYVSVADPELLTELEEAGEGALMSLAADVGGVRLIDNVVLRSAIGAGKGGRASMSPPNETAR